MGTVVSVVRYPLKSARGQPLAEVDVDAVGVRWDRAWACLDGTDGSVGSVKHPRRWGGLLEVAASVRADGTDCTLTVGGRRVTAGTAEAEAVLGTHLGRRVRLTRDVPARAQLHRLLPEQAGLVPGWMRDVRPGQELVTDVQGAQPGGRFVDFGAVHLVTTGALALLAQRLGRPAVQPQRFRPNLVLDLAQDPVAGQELRIGEVVLRTVLPTPRCVVPGLSHDAQRLDVGLLKMLARDYRMPVLEHGHAACFGVYADVVQQGRIAVGDAVRRRSRIGGGTEWRTMM